MNLADLYIAKKLAGGGGGGTGTDNYNDLSNKPQINGTTLTGDKSAADLELQPTIDSENPISADYVDDSASTNKFVTSSDKLTWGGKQDKIDADHKLSSDLVDDTGHTNLFVTPTEKSTWSGKQNAIDSSHKLSSDLVDDTNHTNKFVTSAEKNTWNAKQNAIDSDHKLSSSLVSFSTAEAAALASGIDSDDVNQIGVNQTNILYGINNTVKNICKVDVNTILSHNPGSTASGNVITKDNHVYFTISDGEITVNSDGSNSQVILQLCNYDDFILLDNTDYTLLGCSSGSNTKYDLRVSLTATSNVPQYTTPVTVSHATESNYNVSIVVRASQSLSNIKIKPMLCLKSIYDQDSSYQPYAKPNYDLTRLEAEDRSNISSISETVNILKLSEFNNAFGMKISKSDTNPNTKVSYMFNAEGMTPAYMDFTGGSFNFGGFSSWKPVADNRPVGLNFDGSVAYELNHTDFSKKLDGTASDITDATKTINFMSEMPLMYVRRWEDENYNYIVFCEYQTNENYTADAFKNANGGMGSKLYLPMFKGSYVDGKLRSLAKQYWQNNADVQGTEAEWNAAVACGTGWQTWDWAKREYLSDLMTFITKSTDWKNKFGRGVTNRSTSNNNKFDGQPTGGYCSMSGDLTTWTADYHGQFYGVASTTSDKKHVTAFYVEDPYGNRWERTPGLELYNNVYRAKMSPPYALTDSASRAEYDNLGISAPAEGWFKTASTSIHGSVPVAVGASETTGYCSYFYKNASGVRFALFGGTCVNGGGCGRCVSLNGAPSGSFWSVGASPCFVSP